MKIEIEKVGYKYDVKIYNEDNELIIWEAVKNISVKYPADCEMILTHEWKNNNEDVA